MFKQFFLNFLAALETERVTMRHMKLVAKCVKHSSKHPDSAVAKAFQDAQDELDDVDDFCEAPNEFWAAENN
jgi:hypothetical protein